MIAIYALVRVHAQKFRRTFTNIYKCEFNYYVSDKFILLFKVYTSLPLQIRNRQTFHITWT